MKNTLHNKIGLSCKKNGSRAFPRFKNVNLNFLSSKRLWGLYVLNLFCICFELGVYDKYYSSDKISRRTISECVLPCTYKTQWQFESVVVWDKKLLFLTSSSERVALLQMSDVVEGPTQKLAVLSQLCAVNLKLCACESGLYAKQLIQPIFKIIV